MPVPGDGEALVRIEVSALCGSERAAVTGGFAGGNAGHEACGIVEWAPAGSGFAVGERVGISAIRGCAVCPPCLAGVETRCTRGPVLQLGLHAEYATPALATLRRLPAGTDAVTGVLMSGDALGVPVRALRRVPSGEGTRVLVIGLGPVGLAHVAVRSAAASEVVAIEPSPTRRRLGMDLGASAVHHPDEVDIEVADIVIEATGLPACVARAFDLAASGGTVLQSGECASAPIRPSHDIVHREVTYAGAWYYATEDYPDMVRIESQGLGIRRLVTDELPARDAQLAFDRFFGGDAGKVVLRWHPG